MSHPTDPVITAGNDLASDPGGYAVNERQLATLTGLDRSVINHRLADLKPYLAGGKAIGNYYLLPDAMAALIAAINDAKERRAEALAQKAEIEVAERRRRLIPIDEFRSEIENLCSRLMDALRAVIPDTAARNQVIRAIRAVSIPEEVDATDPDDP